MTNLMQRGATWLGAKLKSSAGQVITYARNSPPKSTLSGITGWVSDQVYAIDGGDGLFTEIIGYSWTFKSSDLTLTPAAGDNITCTINGTESVWQVMRIAGGKHFDWADTSRRLIKVHTKQIK